MLPGIGVFGTAAEVNVLVPILRAKGFKIEAIWGRTAREAEEAAKQLSIPFHTNKIDDVLLKKDVDLVFIVCPPFLHSQISVKALGIGKHVVCDKPMGLGQADALKMVRGSQYYPSLISLVNYSLRFLPAFVQLKRMLNEEEYLGPKQDITMIDIRVEMGSLLRDKFDWLCDATMGGGALNLVGSHVIDLVSFLMDKHAIRVHGIVRTHNKTSRVVSGIRQVTAPDFCNFQMELDDGGVIVTVSIITNNSCTKFTQEVLICGRDGQLIVRNGDLFGRRNDNATESALYSEESNADDDGNVQNSATTTPPPTTNVDNLLPMPYIKGIAQMVSALRESFIQEQSSWIKEPVEAAATFEDGLYVQAVLDAVRRSSESKSWIKVSIMSESPTNHAKIMTAARMSAVVMH